MLHTINQHITSKEGWIIECSCGWKHDPIPYGQLQKAYNLHKEHVSGERTNSISARS